MTRLIIDMPTTRADAVARLGDAARRAETWLCAALAVGICIEIAIGVLRTAALYPVGP